MEKKSFIKVQGKIYVLLRMYGGIAHLGLPFDVNNERAKCCIIWEKQPVYFQKEFGLKDRAFIQYCLLVRFFKRDIFGNSGFINFYRKTISRTSSDWLFTLLNLKIWKLQRKSHS